MRGFLVYLWLLFLGLTLCSTTTANAQSSQASSRTGSDRWVSHQMNQPPPENRDKYAISPSRIEEIKQLYLEAKKELDDKQRPKSSDGK